jgi:hypothetical protein
MHEALAARYAERARLIAIARLYVEQLSARVVPVAAIVAGSVARGDFNVWSDVDVVIVAEDLPARALDRIDLLTADAPPGLQPFGYTLAELEEERRRGNPLVCSALSEGIALAGADFVAGLRET